ncbi:MAG: isochorismatase family protein [Planctomycetota bacterium]
MSIKHGKPSVPALSLVLVLLTNGAYCGETTRTYVNRLTPIKDPQPLLADHPQFVEPIRETARFEAPMLLDDENADLSVRAWRFSYNARGIIEVPNRLRSKETAVIVVHPWGIDDGQGWRTPEPAGVCDFCTPAKNHLSHEHIVQVVNPFLHSLRPHVGLVAYSLINGEDPIRKKLYRSIRGRPTEAERREGAEELAKTLNGFKYQGEAVPDSFTVSKDKPLRDYFKQFPGLDAGPRYNNEGFWKLPVPVVRGIDVDPEDLLIYDADGYPALRDFLQKEGIRHVLLAGYATDMCFCKTTAGYENLSRDFNVFLVGDATLATFPQVTLPVMRLPRACFLRFPQSVRNPGLLDSAGPWSRDETLRNPNANWRLPND